MTLTLEVPIASFLSRTGLARAAGRPASKTSSGSEKSDIEFEVQDVIREAKARMIASSPPGTEGADGKTGRLGDAAGTSKGSSEANGCLITGGAGQRQVR